ncbi:MAG: hypothetical protein NT105_12310 [Verrucomicrobia bacterium]|nr:hypothetical protein [Verrucomicrobiota bacterium]
MKKLCILSLAVLLLSPLVAEAAQLQAGVAKVDITDRTVPVNDPLFAKALVLRDGTTTVAIITVDAVAIGQLGRIKNDFLPNVRAQLQKEFNIPPSNVLINASHCHGVVCNDYEKRAMQAVRDACRNMVPVKIGAGRGREDRVSENRRLKLKDGSESDVRHAYSVVPDEQVVAIGPMDPEIGLLRLDKQNGQPLAVVYNFAVHPIQTVPSRGNTADITGFASKAIEESLGDGALAIFLQGCCGDINPVQYKDVHNPRDAETLGNLLGLSTLRALKKIQTQEDSGLRVINEVLALPRAIDMERRIAAIQAEQTRLLQSLRGTSLNLKTFIPLFVQYNLATNFPSYSSHRYLLDKSLGRDDLAKLDSENRANMASYIRNIHTMEQLTRLQANLSLLKMHKAQNDAAGKPTIDVEVVGLRIGDFVLVTFPGELTVEVGLGIKKRAPAPFTFVAGYTNGYIYYAPTAERRKNKGFAQEDCDCLLAPEWQKLYEEKVAAILKKL